MSSDAAPTESNSAKVVEDKARIELKEEAGFRVDVRAKQQYLMSCDPLFQNNKTAFKCPTCGLLSIHVGVTITMYGESGKNEKRVWGCTNCGAVRTK